MSVYIKILKGGKVRTISVLEDVLKDFDYGLLSLSGEILPWVKYGDDVEERLEIETENLFEKIQERLRFKYFNIYI